MIFSIKEHNRQLSFSKVFKSENGIIKKVALFFEFFSDSYYIIIANQIKR